jgi:hypothetical protein
VNRVQGIFLSCFILDAFLCVVPNGACVLGLVELIWVLDPFWQVHVHLDPFWFWADGPARAADPSGFVSCVFENSPLADSCL